MHGLLDKQGLLSTMRKLRACNPAFEWVDAQEGSAEEILLRLERVDWLCWLLGRLRPSEIATFARGCADRAASYADAADAAAASYADAYAYADAADAAGARASYADAYAYAAYADASYAAAYAAHASYAASCAASYADAAGASPAVSERSVQLTQLHELAKAICTVS